MSQQANYAVYDLETTGLKPDRHGVCEIAIMIIDSVTLEELGRYEAVIAPYKLPYYDNEGKLSWKDYEIDPYALKVNGFTEARIKAGKDAKEVCKEIAAFMKKYGGSKKCKLVGHNIEKFDNPHLAQLFEAVKMSVEKVFSSLYFKDTQGMSHDMFPDAVGKGEHTLARLCERLGVDKFDAHSAMPDVIANAQAFVKMMKKLRGEVILVGTEDKDRPRDTFKIA